jgi:hypothetical protein
MWIALLRIPRQQSKTVRWHSMEKVEGEQPRINVAAIREMAHESIERRESSRLRPIRRE